MRSSSQRLTPETAIAAYRGTTAGRSVLVYAHSPFGVFGFGGLAIACLPAAVRNKVAFGFFTLIVNSSLMVTIDGTTGRGVILRRQREVCHIDRMVPSDSQGRKSCSSCRISWRFYSVANHSECPDHSGSAGSLGCFGRARVFKVTENPS